MAEDWEGRGWLEKDRFAADRRKVTAELAALAAKRQARQTCQGDKIEEVAIEI